MRAFSFAKAVFMVLRGVIPLSTSAKNKVTSAFQMNPESTHRMYTAERTSIFYQNPEEKIEPTRTNDSRGRKWSGTKLLLIIDENVPFYRVKWKIFSNFAGLPDGENWRSGQDMIVPDPRRQCGFGFITGFEAYPRALDNRRPRTIVSDAIFDIVVVVVPLLALLTNYIRNIKYKQIGLFQFGESPLANLPELVGRINEEERYDNEGPVENRYYYRKHDNRVAPRGFFLTLAGAYLFGGVFAIGCWLIANAATATHRIVAKAINLKITSYLRGRNRPNEENTLSASLVAAPKIIRVLAVVIPELKFGNMERELSWKWSTLGSRGRNSHLTARLPHRAPTASISRRWCAFRLVRPPSRPLPPHCRSARCPMSRSPPRTANASCGWSRTVVDRLTAMRQSGESYSDVILRIVAQK